MWKLKFPQNTFSALEGLLDGNVSAATVETNLSDVLPSPATSSSHQLAPSGREDSLQLSPLTLSDEEYSSAVAGKGTHTQMYESVSCYQTCRWSARC